MPQPISADEAPPKPANDTEAQTDKEEKSSRKRTLESIGDNAAVQENALRKTPEKKQPAPTSHAHDVEEPKNKRSKSTDLTKEERLAVALSKAPKPSVDYLPLGQAITIPPRAAAAPAETASNPPLAKKRGRPKIDPATKKAVTKENKAKEREEKKAQQLEEKEKKKADLQAKKAEAKKAESTGVYAGEFALIAFRTVTALSCADMLSLLTLQ
jgi:DNA mismatch repair ATPase MutL